jgi:hypothetical protein
MVSMADVELKMSPRVPSTTLTELRDATTRFARFGEKGTVRLHVLIGERRIVFPGSFDDSLEFRAALSDWGTVS